MNDVEIIGLILSDNEKRYPVGWNKETKAVCYSKEAGDIIWKYIGQFATTEREAMFYAKEYISRL